MQKTVDVGLKGRFSQLNYVSTSQNMQNYIDTILKQWYYVQIHVVIQWDLFKFHFSVE